MYKYFDVHTHKPSGDDVLSIVNLRFGETPGDGLFSVGLHPRDIGKIPADTAFEAMIQIVASSGCVAVGEAGIDKLI